MHQAGDPAVQHALVVDADPELCGRLAAGVAGALLSAEVATSHSGKAALELVRTRPFALLIVELNSIVDLAPGPVAALTRLVRHCTGARVLALSDGGAVSTVLAALEAGAHDHAPRRIEATELSARLRALAGRHGGFRLAGEVTRPIDTASFEGMVGQSSQMRVVYEQILRAADSEGPVFIAGEAGAGKDLCARALHRRSRRAGRPFISVACADTPAGRLEAELFGADAANVSDGGAIGALARAAGGTLYLDEVGALDLSVQARLLRLLQAGRYSRVGDAAERAADVRLICATACNPMQLIAERRLREDLFYRLHVLPIHLPPLRQRQGDIGALASHLLARHAAIERKAVPDLTANAVAVLAAADWPGNVRALERLMQRVVLMYLGGPVDADQLLLADFDGVLSPGRAASGAPRPGTILPMWQQEQRIIEEAIQSCGGNIALAAQALELSPSTIYRKRQAWAEMDGRKGAA